MKKSKIFFIESNYISQDKSNFSQPYLKQKQKINKKNLYEEKKETIFQYVN